MKHKGKETNAVADTMLSGYLPDDAPTVKEKAKTPKPRTGRKPASTEVDVKVKAEAEKLLRWSVLDLMEAHGFMIKGGADSLAFAQKFSELVGQHCMKKGGDA
jgi:hypothetical protein